MRVEQLADSVTLYLGDCREILPTLFIEKPKPQKPTQEAMQL